ncbi:MAG: AAA family ATPase [Desulfovibrio sp.]|nr:AAA family ATPase [Desulfovibrio sp.]
MSVMPSPEDTLLELAFAVEPIEPGEANETAAAQALRHARLLPGFTLEGTRCRVLLPLAEAGIYRDVLLDIWDALARQPGASLQLGPIPLEASGLRQLFTILDCAAACDKAEDERAYCEAGHVGWNWGCRYLRHVPPVAATEPTPGSEPAAGQPPLALPERLREVATARLLHLCRHFQWPRVERLAQDYRAAEPAPHTARVLDAFSLDPFRPGERHGDAAPPAQPERRIRKTTYAEVGGLDAVVRELREIIELPLRHPEVLKRLGIPHHRGVLLHGPPGCGKTLLARALAHESGAAFLPVSGPELITKWHGESEERLRALFAEAQERQPSIVFFDEIDAIAQSRSANENLRLDARFTAQLLTIMDGVHELGQVFVLAATNRADLLDPALLRPGRFDRIVAIPPPDEAGRLQILQIHAAPLPLHPDVQLEAIARRLTGMPTMTGADIACLAREAGYAAFRRTFSLEEVLREKTALSEDALQALQVTAEDFETALRKVQTRESLHADLETKGETP